jgi:hypothetical protein
MAGPGVAGVGLVGRGRGRRARRDVVKGDSEAAMGSDATLGQVQSHCAPRCRSQIAFGPGVAVVVASHGEAGQRDVIGVSEAFGALVLRVPGDVALVARVLGSDGEGRRAANDGFGRGYAEL